MSYTQQSPFHESWNRDAVESNTEQLCVTSLPQGKHFINGANVCICPGIETIAVSHNLLFSGLEVAYET